MDVPSEANLRERGQNAMSRIVSGRTRRYMEPNVNERLSASTSTIDHHITRPNDIKSIWEIKQIHEEMRQTEC